MDYEKPSYFQEELSYTKASTFNEANTPSNEEQPLIIKIKGRKPKSQTLKLKKRNSNTSSSVYKKN